VTQPGSRAVKIGVVLAPPTGHLGGWLADATAFEAAGAHALWIDLAPGSALDPLALTAALSALTARSLLVTSLPTAYLPSRALANTLATLARLCGGRLRVLVDALPLAGIGAPPEIGTSRAGIGAPPAGADAGMDAVPGAFSPIPGLPDTFTHTHEPDLPERWISAAPGPGRPGWQAVLAGAAQRGADGLLVPAHPQLLDILRNPEDPGDRRDLQLAVG
jgi:hypothetical protein